MCFVLFCLNTPFFFLNCVPGLHVMMKKKERVGECTGVAPDLQHARAALLVCVLAVKSVDFQTAVARLALISPGMQKLN